MNAGMFGMADGRGTASRLIARGSNQPAGPVFLTASYMCSSLGLSASAVVASASVTVKYNLLRISGKGALRFFAITNSTGFGANLDIEIVIDGLSVIYRSGTAISNNASMLGCGSVNSGQSYSPGVNLDFMPFNSSLELNFMGSIGSYTPVIVYDLYQ